ncbi:MAG TPA: carboxymuconolactone decarboxylase family protein [Planctomycetota bacterium]|nr:carboxymuconolactone decarboxylase family protein [Planctomycetota bacterium]
MAWVRTIPEGEAEGLLKRIYDDAKKRAGKVYEILKVQSLRPHSLRAMIELYAASTLWPQSPLTRAQREMIAVAVSAANRCRY